MTSIRMVMAPKAVTRAVESILSFDNSKEMQNLLVSIVEQLASTLVSQEGAKEAAAFQREVADNLKNGSYPEAGIALRGHVKKNGCSYTLSAADDTAQNNVERSPIKPPKKKGEGFDREGIETMIIG